MSQDWNNLKKFKNFTLDQEIDMRGNFVFRVKSKRLCKPPFCDKDYSNNQKRCKYKLVLKLLDFDLFSKKLYKNSQTNKV